MTAPTVNPGLFGFAPPHNLLAPPPVGGAQNPAMTPYPATTGPINPTGAFDHAQPNVQPTVAPSSFALPQPTGPGPEVNPVQSLPGVNQPPTGMAPPPSLPMGHQMALNRLRNVGNGRR